MSLKSLTMPVVFSMSETSRIFSLKWMDVLRCHLTARQPGQFSPWRTGKQPVGGEWAVAWARGRHRRPSSACHFEWATQIMLSMVMHWELPLTKIGCSKLSLMHWLGCACLSQDVSLPSFKDETTQAHSEWWKGRDVLLKVFVCVCVSPYGWLIKESTVSISLEIYRILPTFSFILVHLLWHSSIGALRMLFSLFPLSQQDYIMARRRMHSLYIQWMPQWIEMTNNCFSLTKSAAFMLPRAWHSWVLGTSHGVLWTWNIFFYVSFFSLCSLCLSFSAFLQWFSLIVLSGLSCSLYVLVFVCIRVSFNMLVFILILPHNLW